MRRTFLYLSMLMLAVPAMAQKGWEPLFDGKSLQGWHLFKKPGVAPAWKVQDGAIYLDVSTREGRGDLITDEEFGDFEFSFEWKVAPASNSGVIFFCQESETFAATWHTGPEYQVIDNTGYPDKLQPGQMAASLYDMIPCPPEYIRPTGEWNQTTIRFVKGRLTFIVNDKKAVDIEVGGKEWQELIAKSKFATMKDFAKNTRGRIALQDHGGAVWYRAMKIRSY
jgi:hypothetical protein